MKTSSLAHVTRQCLALGLVSLPWWGLAQAQPQTSTPAQAWRDANQAVGQFPRGHADVLKWERQHTPANTAAAPQLPGLVLDNAEAVVRLAWQNHRDLARPLARLGAANAELIASGRWLALDPKLFGRIEGLDEVLEVAALARKAWVQAVASQHLLPPLQEALDAASDAAELGQRMVNTGNWSALQQSPVALAHSNARLALQRAQYAAAQAQATLLKTVQRQDLTAVGLPAAAPSLTQSPADTLSPETFEQHLAAQQAQRPWGNRTRHAADARLAFAAYQASQTVLRIQRDEVLAQRTFILNETVLHYNGMLKSTWDLLSEAQAKAQAQANAMVAQRDADLALIDLQWVLLGGTPDSLVTLGGSDSTAPASNGH